MKRYVTICLQAVIALIGIGTLVLLLWEPHVEGVNAHATTLQEIYFDDPFLAYVYVAFIPFFVALYHTFKVVGYVRQSRAVSEETVKALRTITHCAVAFALLIAGAVAYIVVFVRGSDDIAGGVAVGLLHITVGISIASVAAFFERQVRALTKGHPL